ncbi:hypothetical protein HU200_006960 [Digitaria exilis]|uniref:AAA+ ATPase domain-containing protein n=1 Tax=Digitaria exilis TaxID=1010633 RepID=A0A835KQ72_9POAL|nr:hypothetical protein HU200_059404 [Digitaria exilis]KAF8769069.1 hypothetical protein HU200_006960 [Digitaria exilis]
MQFAIRAASWVVGKALSPIVDGFLEAWAASTGLGPNVEDLKLQLLYAEAMLSNARREMDNPALNELLHKLRDLAYGADDELDYFRIQDELHGTHHAAAAGCVQGLVLNAGHTCRAVASKLRLIGTSQAAPQKRRSEETPKLKLDRVAISKRMKDIVEQLKPVCGMVSTILSLELQGSNHAAIKDSATKRTTQDIIIDELYGRNDQLNIITDGITHGEYSAKHLTVLPIVGPGGIGKTTLAQHVYQKVKSHFHVSIWICVSLNFNANRLAQEIVKKIPEVSGENKNASEEEIIEQRVKSKRFLLVLDDIWTCQEDERRKLLAPFGKGEETGNMVIVTTRFPEVAKMVGMSNCLMELGGLGAQDFMRFFEACAFGYQQPWEDHPELSDIGTKIVNKLKGSPLAAKTVGKLLRNQLTLQHWRRVLESKEWELQTSDNDIMPALKLSYDYLPFHLQQCFSYCALFPEDYRFYSSELIRLWMGLDILHPVNQNERIEDVGHRYFEDLVKFAFLKRNEIDNEPPYYVVHDLLHELATKASSHECLSICSSNVRSTQIPTSIRHLSIIVENEDVKDRETFEHYKKDLGALDERLKVENPRTLMVFGQHHECFVKTFSNLFQDATMLRSVLCKASHNIKDLLPNFSKLVHLRHLSTKDSYAGRIILPSTISRLYHLKILDVRGKIVSILPKDLSNLINLHHFIFSDDIVQYSYISEVGKLKHLKELSRFDVKRENNGFELKQLGHLLELQVLGIYGLQNVETKEEAYEANLNQNDHLQELTLNWDMKRTEQPMQEEDILECLKPNSNLLKLCIRGHGGVKCPAWLGMNLSVQNLEYLRLDHVAWEKLPPLGGSWMLNGYVEDFPNQSFMNLKRLELVNIRNLERWVQSGFLTLIFSWKYLSSKVV